CHSSTAQVPAGFRELLQDFAVAVLRQSPDDAVEFAIEYFTRLRIGRMSSQKPVEAPWRRQPRRSNRTRRRRCHRKTSTKTSRRLRRLRLVAALAGWRWPARASTGEGGPGRCGQAHCDAPEVRRAATSAQPGRVSHCAVPVPRRGPEA
ncbi:hypothetical protein BOX15_Mlig033844g3, partial [Macrostomum lignano]